MKPKNSSIEKARKNTEEYREYMETIDIEYFINNKRAM